MPEVKLRTLLWTGIFPGTAPISKLDYFRNSRSHHTSMEWIIQRNFLWTKVQKYDKECDGYMGKHNIHV